MARYKAQWVIVLGLALASLGYNLFLLHIPVNIYDEGIILAGADRILRGETPYADFWAMYPPGQFYSVAFLFKWFGQSILVERIYDLVVRSILVLSGFLIIRQLGRSNREAIIGWALSLVWLGSSWYPLYPVYSSLLLIFFSSFFFLLYINRNNSSLLVIGGALLTLAAMFRHDLAGMAAISMLATLGLRKKREEEKGITPILNLLSGILLLGVPVTIYFMTQVGLIPLVEQLLVTPSKVMGPYRSLPYPGPFPYNELKFYLFPLVAFLVLILSLRQVVKLGDSSPILGYGTLFLSLMAVLFINQVRVRSDTIHLLPVVLICITLLPSLLCFLLNSSLMSIRPKATRWALSLSVLLVVGLFVKPIEKKVKSIKTGYFSISTAESLLASGLIEPDLEKLIIYIRENTNSDDAIYVGVSNHDQFIINDVIVYFLAQRSYATRYHELHPGVTTTLAVQKKIVKDLESSLAKLIVLSTRYWDEPNDTQRDLGVDYLDHYIQDTYEKVQTMGIYEVWMRQQER